MKTLIIEDDEGCRASLAMFLDGEKVFATNMSEAIRTLQTDHFDAVFLDLGLPDSPPDQTLLAIPGLKSLASNAAFAIVTGFSGQLDAQLVDAIVHKPFDRRGIESAVEQIEFRRTRNQVFASPVKRATGLLMAMLRPPSVCA